MDIRQLRYFLQVCQYGSILQTSNHVFISQQALSKCIHSLEQELELPLFRRTSKGLVLTEHGRQLKELAQPVVDAMDHLTEELYRSAKKEKNLIRFGTTSALQYFVGNADPSLFTALNPSLKIIFEEHPFYQCEALVREGALTAALVNGPVESPDLVTIPLFHRQRIAILPKTSPLASQECLQIRDLAGQNLVSNINNRCYENFCALCRAQGFSPTLHRVGDNSTVYELCSSQNYIGISIDFTLLLPQPRYPNLIALPIEFSDFSYPVDLIVSPAQYNRAAIRPLIEYIQKTALKRNEETIAFPFYFA